MSDNGGNKKGSKPTEKSHILNTSGTPTTTGNTRPSGTGTAKQNQQVSSGGNTNGKPQQVCEYIIRLYGTSDRILYLIRSYNT